MDPKIKAKYTMDPTDTIQVFFDIDIGFKPAGRIVFELYRGKIPFSHCCAIQIQYESEVEPTRS